MRAGRESGVFLTCDSSLGPAKKKARESGTKKRTPFRIFTAFLAQAAEFSSRHSIPALASEIPVS